MLFARCVLAAAVAVVLGSGASVSGASASEIAFVTGDSIWAARADGGERRLLISPAGPGHGIAQPVWSPDGSMLAYVSGVAPRGQQGTDADSARLMLFDGTSSRALTPRRKGTYDLGPAWSPDGSMVAFGRSTEARTTIRSEIVTRVLATGAERTLVRMRLGRRFEHVAEPAWSPDGSTIAYTQTRLDADGDFRPLLRILPAAGGRPRTLIRDAQSAVWSPDGSRLAFSSVRDRNGKRCGSDECWYAGELYTAAADGTGLRRLTVNEGDDAGPRWSPDGSRLLFTSDRNLPEGNSSEVYSIGADGRCLTWLTNGTPGSVMPAWRPGSGAEFHPGNCDPGSRAVLIDLPTLPAVRDGLWLGSRFRGLLASHATRHGDYTTLAYDDCERFDPRRCPETALLTSQRACRPATFLGLSRGFRRFLPRRGAVLAYDGPLVNAKLLSGHAVTTIQLEGRNRLADVDRIVRALRPLPDTGSVRRLAPPRVPRRLARELELTARAFARHQSVRQVARVLRIRRSQVQGRLRLRKALLADGRYRFSTCRRSSAVEAGLRSSPVEPSMRPPRF